MSPETVDYSLYLVTDSTPAILRERDIVDVVRGALEGGVTVVQYRDKNSNTKHLINTASRLLRLTKRYNVPLLINDRLDVALAVGADGLHIGQDDIDYEFARKSLGPKALIGVTVSNIEEARAAAAKGATYLGIGTMFATSTKENTKAIIGTSGTKQILTSLSAVDKRLATVAIGGINAENVQRVLYQSKATFKALDGVAVVSAIIGADEPELAARHLKSLVSTHPPFVSSAPSPSRKTREVQSLIRKIPSIIKKLHIESPLCHNMTNLVVQNFAANVAIAVGASPIMANYGKEADDLSQLGGSLLINMGTVTPEGLQNYLQALKAYNKVGGPVVLDPVGAGATSIRRDAVERLLAGGYFDVIKGNEGEITTVIGETQVQQKGVDSSTSTTNGMEKARLAKTLAVREQNIVLLTGKVDYLSDGDRTYIIANGHEYLGKITGSGCTLGTTIASVIPICREDKLLAVLAGVLMFEIAAQHAASRPDVKGPGTFVPAFIDELYDIVRETIKGKSQWLAAASVTEVQA